MVSVPGEGAPLIGAQPVKDTVKRGSMNHANFIIDNPGKIIEFYELDRKKLGEGSYGSVCKGKNKSTSQIRAVKTIGKAQMKNVERFKQEIALMKMMDHPNIIKLFESFEDRKNVYLILELCTGGELFDRIIEAGHFTETQAATLMQQMIRGVYYMHENKVAHRDLKPENFLFSNKDAIDKKENILKIIDFGLSCKFEPGQVLTTRAGTPYYVAPQVLQGRYNHMCDTWTLGVIMYVMLSGFPPFHGDTDPQVLAKVKAGKYSFNHPEWQDVSEDAKDLIKKLLIMKQEDRFSAEQALNHTWIKNTAPKAKKVALTAGFVNKLRCFRSQNKLKKAALHVIAGQLDDTQIKALRDIFMALDANGDGLLTAAEMRTGMQKSGLKEVPADLQQILEDVDSDGSGVIDYTEFLAATLDKHSYMQRDVCWAAFRIFDKNGDGKISMDELKAVINDGEVKGMTNVQTLASIMQEMDKNGDGLIDFEEFMGMMKGGGSKML